MIHRVESQAGPEGTVFDHYIWQDGQVDTVLRDRFGWSIDTAESKARIGFAADAICVNRDAIMERQGWA